MVFDEWAPRLLRRAAPTTPGVDAWGNLINRAGVTGKTYTESLRRVAQAFDLAGISNKVGAPSFAHFAKGGSRKCLPAAQRDR